MDDTSDNQRTTHPNHTPLDRHQADALIEQLSRQNELILSSAGEGILGLDALGNVTFANPAAAKMVGWAAQDLLGKSHHDLVHHTKPDGRPYPKGECLVNATLEDGVAYGVSDELFWRKDGTGFHVEYTSTPIREQDEVTGAVLVFRDITARQQAEDALQKRTHDLDERVKELNCLYGISSLVQEPGISLEEVLQGTVELIPPAWQYPDITCARITLQGQEFGAGDLTECPWKHTADLTVHGEHIGAVEVGYLKQRPGYGKAPFLQEERTLLDAIAERVGRIVERRQAQEALRYERGKVTRILEAMEDGVCMISQDHELEYVNPALEREFGPVEGKKCYEYFYDRGQVCARCKSQDVLAGKSVRWEWHSPTNQQTYDLLGTPLENPDGTISKLEIFRNVTQRVRAEKEIANLARFPSENPNPVLRVAQGGMILYANDGSAPLLAEWGVQVGQKVPAEWPGLIGEALVTGASRVCEMSSGGRVFSLTVAPVVVEGYANLYGLDITQRVQARQALRRYADRLQLLRQTDQDILAARSAEEMAEAVLHRVPQLLPCLRASVVSFDLATDEMSLLALHTASGTQSEKGRHGPVEQEWLWGAKELRQGLPYIVEDVQRLTPSSPLVARLQAEGVRAQVCMPLIAQGNLIGSLNLGMSIPGPLASEGMDVARELADQLAIGIQQARLSAKVRRHADEMERQVARRTAALRVSQARFRAIFEEAAVGIALVNGVGRIINANPALQRMLGYNVQELEDRTFTGLGHPDDLAVDTDLFEGLIAGQRKEYSVEKRFVRGDGGLIDAHLTVSLVEPAKGRARFAIAMVEDITERKQAQAALIRSEKLALTGRLAASLAHEINNPMQSVIGCLSLAEEILPDGGDVSEHLQIALSELRRTARIVGRLRDLNRSSRPEERELVDVNALVSKALVLTRKRCQNQRIEVVWNGADRLPSVPLVPDRLQQVFLNIVLNAIDAMPGGGRLQVCTARTSEPDGVRIAFADDGAGIDADARAQLFEPFHSTRLEGLGLGLYVSQNIVEDHAGTIEIESRPQEGTTFTVWLPAQERGIHVGTGTHSHSGR